MRRRQRSSWPASSAVRAATRRSRSALRQSLSEAGTAAGIRILSLMIFGRLRNLAVLAAAAALPLAVQAGPSDEALLGAYDAYRAGDALKFARYAKRLEGQVLDPWIDYWRIAMRLEDTPSSEVQAFFEQRANTYVAELLRVDWLKVLGKRGEWAEFERQLALYPRDDLEVGCCATRASTPKRRRGSSRAASPRGCRRRTRAISGRRLPTKRRAIITRRRSSGTRAPGIISSTKSSSPGRRARPCAPATGSWCTTRST